MKRQVGNYCAEYEENDIVEVVFFDGDSYFRQGMSGLYSEKDFNWICNNPITLEEPKRLEDAKDNESD